MTLDVAYHTLNTKIYNKRTCVSWESLISNCIFYLFLFEAVNITLSNAIGDVVNSKKLFVSSENLPFQWSNARLKHVPPRWQKGSCCSLCAWSISMCILGTNTWCEKELCLISIIFLLSNSKRWIAAYLVCIAADLGNIRVSG